MISIFVRAERFQNEYRTPLVPEDIQALIESGISVYVESSSMRCISDKNYADISGCSVTKKSWRDPQFQDSFILGIKELQDLEDLSGNTHVYFSHSLKQQAGSERILQEFVRSNSQLYDFEYFTDGSGVRLIAFGWYAGIVGAALGLQEYGLRKKGASLQKLYPWSSFKSLVACIPHVGQPKIAVLGAKGRCGQGVCKVLDTLHLAYTVFLRGDPISDLEQFDILYNCIVLDESYTKIWFSEETHCTHPLVIIDISCDYSKPNNPIRMYSQATTWANPVIHPVPNVSLVAIENLPSLLPRESSIHFSKCLTDLLFQLQKGEVEVWGRAFQQFQKLSLKRASLEN
jgi:saccharopine dehydrogenase (NAD+, L-lysine-forming)